MITEDELSILMGDLESFRVERTTSVSDTTKFCEAICAFANDMPNSKQPGYLLVGVNDSGEPRGVNAPADWRPLAAAK